MIKPRRRKKLTRKMLSARFSGSEILAPTAENFPALKNFWDKNHVSGYVLSDTVGSQDITSSTHEWGVDEYGFHKFTTTTEQRPAGEYDAPGDNDFMLIGVGRLQSALGSLRLVTIGGDLIDPDPTEAGLSFDPSGGFGNYSAYFNASNYRANDALSFVGDIASAPKTGCFAVVVSPSAGTVTSHWAGRDGSGAEYEVVSTYADSAGSIAQTWSSLGAGWTMNDSNRLEWCGYMIFESGAPLDMQAAMEWMAQYDDVRMYPAWRGKG